MEGSETLSLSKKFLRSRDDDDHVGFAVSMMVLVGNVIDILRHREGASKVRGRLRLVPRC